LSTLPEDLQFYKERRKVFKLCCKHKKDMFPSKQRKTLVDSRTDPKLFWKILKISRTKEVPCSSISASTWRGYFSSPLYSEQVTEVTDCDDNPHIDESANVLNAPITEEEIIQCVNKLVAGKSPGIDGIGTEFYKCTVVEIVPSLPI
jgi:hypothetical protein